MKNKLLLILATTFALSSCGSKYKFWETSRFNLDQNALAEGQEVKIIYYSGGPDVFETPDDQMGVVTVTDNDGKVIDKYQELEFYQQYVVFAVDTKDTFNILSEQNIGICADDKDKVFTYTQHAGISAQILQNLGENIDPEQLKNLNLTDNEQLEKVARDPEFDHVADNQHPTVIGRIKRTED